MNPQKIAILVDSCTDVPQEYIDAYGIYFVPITVIYRDGEYRDKLEISAQEVYDRLEFEVPRTSLPSADSIRDALQEIQEAGFEKVLIITIASALSGTNNLMNLIARDFPELEIRVLDTRSIGFGAGTQALLAGELIAKGESFESICEKLEQSMEDSRIFFCLSTLDYLAKGGRIGKVAAVLGSLLHIKPIITCNPEGAYAIAARVRGRAASIAETVSLAVQEARKHLNCCVAVIQGNAVDEAKRVAQEVMRRIPNIKLFIETTVSPALVVHTGPGLVGISIQALPSA